MNGADRSVKNTVKNVSLLLLVLLLGLLCAANWLSGVNMGQMPADSPAHRLYDSLYGGAFGYEVRSSGLAAAQPAQLALTVDGTLYGVQYNLNDVDEGMAAVRPLWAQVLADGALEAVSESALLAAIQAGDCAVLRYHGGIPLSAVAGWMGGTWKQGANLAAETLVYTAGSGTLFVRTADGALYAAPARAEETVLREAQQAFRGQPCSFAGETYAVYPESLLFEREMLSLPLLTVEPLDLFAPASGGLEGMLSAFEFTAYTDFYSEQNDQVRVFVDNVSTLRVNGTGLLQFAAAGEDSAVRAYNEGEVSGSAVLDAQLDCARQLLDNVLLACDTGTHASLYAAAQAQDKTTLVFMQMYGGVPLLGAQDFAVFTFERGALISATIRLQRFRASQTRRTVLPARQAAAGTSEEMCGMIVAYRMQDKTCIPQRFYWNHTAPAA